MQCTYQTKISNENTRSKVTEYLEDYAKLFNHIERKMYVDIVFKGRTKTGMKKEYMAKYGILARQFNSIYTSIDGKVKALRELKKLEVDEKRLKIRKLDGALKKLEARKKKLFKKLEKLRQGDDSFRAVVSEYQKVKFSIHQKKRKRANIQDKLDKVKTDLRDRTARMCFGSKKLFKSQYRLKENGFKSHEDWKHSWEGIRNSQVFFLGSSDEMYGNSNCQYTTENSILIRVVPALKEKYRNAVELKDVFFKYGQENIDVLKEAYMGETSGGKSQRYFKGSMSHRFMRKEHGWYLFTSVDVTHDEASTDIESGAIGVDFNVNFAAIIQVERYGNPIRVSKIKYEMYSKKSGQIDAMISQMANTIAKKAKKSNMDICIENLDFKTAKTSMKDKPKKYSRMLSGFPYRKYMDAMERACVKEGVNLRKVNPAYTSVIGQVKYMKRYGFSSHTSAALVIARRGMGYTEKFKGKAFLKNESDVGKKPNEHLWSEINKKLKEYTYASRLYILQKIA